MSHIENPLAKATALIVEDSATQAALLEDLLLQQGFAVDIVRNGHQALAAARQHQPDVMLSDIVMPGMDGYELCRSFKDDPELAAIPVVLLTELQSPADIVRAIRAGASGYLVKPCDPDALLERLNYLLANRRFRKNRGVSMSLVFRFEGEDHTATTEQTQLLDLLFSTFEDVLRQKEKLEQTNNELQEALEAVDMLGHVLQGEHTVDDGDVRQLAGTRILIVEDSPVQAELLRSTLEDRGIDVTVARNGEEGLAKTREVLPALVISDVIMPVMDGYELCRQIKEDPALAGIPVVLLTTLSDPTDIVHGINAGADYYLTKPCDGNYLMYRLANIFKAMKHPEEPRTTETTPVQVGGKSHQVRASRRQLLDLMLSTYENSVQQNRELQRLKADLEAMNTHLEDLVDQRTAQLRQQQTLLLEAERITNTGSWEWDIVASRFRFSEEWRRIHGVTTSSMSTQDVLKLIHPDDRQMVKEALHASIDSVSNYLHEARIIRPEDGQERLVVGHGQFLLNEAGKPIKMYGTTRDITSQRLAEAEKRGLQAQLQQAQKLESIGTLASGVAHEINNPINGIMNYAELIKDSLPTDSAEGEYCREIIHETERVATIVRNLLSFSRAEKQSHSPAWMNDIIEATLSLVFSIIRRDQIELTLDVPKDLPQLKCRSQQIQQVLMNLLTNARDALNERYPTYDPDKVILLSVKLYEVDGRRWIRTTVEDHGGGIPSALQEKIFDPFFTTKDRTKGTGLGLSISHGIVEAHHGHLVIESVPETFTRVHLDLPVDNDREPKE